MPVTGVQTCALPICSGTSTISTAVASGSAGTVSLTASGSPTGSTATLSPTSITAGGSSTLNVSVGPSTAPGTYTVTVTGTEGSATHSTTVNVTVIAADDFSVAASPTSLSLTAGSSGKLDVADYERTVATLLGAGGEAPVITKKPEGAWTGKLTEGLK